MCASARPPARATAQAAAQVRKVEARAPALAAAATCPMRLADLVQPDLADLLVLVRRCTLRRAAGVPLREARLVCEATDKAAALLVSLARRIVWRGPQAARDPASGRRLLRLVFGPEVRVLQALCGLLSYAFCVDAGPDRSTAVREAAERCVAQALWPAAGQQLSAAPGPPTASARVQVCAARRIRPGRAPGHVVGGPGGEQPGQGGQLFDLCAARQMRARPASGAPVRPRLAASRSARPAPLRARAAQVASLWFVNAAPEASGGAAAPRAAQYWQYHSSMSAVLLWLTSAPQLLPPLLLATEAAPFADRETLLEGATQVRAARAIRRLRPRSRASGPTARRAARRSTCAAHRCCTKTWLPRARRCTPRTWRPSAARPRATSW